MLLKEWVEVSRVWSNSVEIVVKSDTAAAIVVRAYTSLCCTLCISTDVTCKVQIKQQHLSLPSPPHDVVCPSVSHSVRRIQACILCTLRIDSQRMYPISDTVV